MPLAYKAKLKQYDKDGPTADVMVNTLGSDVVWNRYEPGAYIGRFVPPLDDRVKVLCYAPVRDGSGDITTGSPIDFTMDGNNDAVSILSYGEGKDGIIRHRDIEGGIYVQFEVYGP